MSPTAVQGRADIRMRVAMPLDYEHIRSYSFSVSLTNYVSLQASEHLCGRENSMMETLKLIIQC